MGNLYFAVGIPGAGKSTLLKYLVSITEKSCYISRDEIRFDIVKPNEPYFSAEKRVFKEFIQRIQMELSRGYHVFADATHLNRKSRYKLLSSVHLDKSKHRIYPIYVKVPLETAIEQNAKRSGTRSFVPISSIEQMYQNLEPPSLNEGYDNIFVFENGKLTRMR